MPNPDTSRNVIQRLRSGAYSGGAASQQRFGADSMYVEHVRGYAARIPERDAQHNRLLHRDENWLVSQYRWLVGQRKAGIEFSQIRRVLQACVDECDVMEQMETIAAAPASITAFVDVARVEREAQYQEDAANDAALHERSLSAYQRVADACSTQIEALRTKYRTARLMALKLTTHRSA